LTDKLNPGADGVLYEAVGDGIDKKDVLIEDSGRAVVKGFCVLRAREDKERLLL
jgi:hypothetical protein